MPTAEKEIGRRSTDLALLSMLIDGIVRDLGLDGW